MITKRAVISTGALLLFLAVILIFTGLDGKSNTIKTSNVNYPVKIHISNVSEGETITYYTDGGLSQSINKSSFLINFSPGTHTLCVSVSGNKWGIVSIIRNNNPMIQDVYINVSSENKPCQNNK